MKQKKINIRHILLMIMPVLLVALDQFTKILAVDYLKDKKPFVIWENVFEFQYLENRGAAYGMMNGMRWGFIALTVVIVPAMIWFVFRFEKFIKLNKSQENKHKMNIKLVWLQFIMTFMYAGAIGNLIDRVLNGYVVDFLYFKLIDFPIFNVADCYVTVATILLMIFMIFVLSTDELDEITSFGKKNKIQGVTDDLQ